MYTLGVLALLFISVIEIDLIDDGLGYLPEKEDILVGLVFVRTRREVIWERLV